MHGIGPVEIAAVGVAISIFNQVSKVAIFPLVSITTSFVAEEETIERISKKEGKEFVHDDPKLENLENGPTKNDEQKEFVPGMSICHMLD